MKSLLAAIALFIMSIPAFGAECPADKTYDAALAAVHAQEAKSIASNIHIMETVAKVDEFLLFLNGTYGMQVPMGKADHAIATIIKSDDPNVGGLWVFGFSNGCQMGLLHIPHTMIQNMPKETSA